jgi:hypothetical protein
MPCHHHQLGSGWVALLWGHSPPLLTGRSSRRLDRLDLPDASGSPGDSSFYPIDHLNMDCSSHAIHFLAVLPQSCIGGRYMADQLATPGRCHAVQEDGSSSRKSNPDPDLIEENGADVHEMWKWMLWHHGGGGRMSMGDRVDSGNKFGLVI